MLLPSTRLDPDGGAHEARVVRSAGLERVYAEHSWTIYRLLDPTPLVTGPGAVPHQELRAHHDRRQRHASRPVPPARSLHPVLADKPERLCGPSAERPDLVIRLAAGVLLAEGRIRLGRTAARRRLRPKPLRLRSIGTASIGLAGRQAIVEVLRMLHLSPRTRSKIANRDNARLGGSDDRGRPHRGLLVGHGSQSTRDVAAPGRTAAQPSTGTSAAADAAATNRPVPATANRRRRRAGFDAASHATSAVERSP